MVYITHIRLSGGSKHEHISEVKWKNPSSGDTGQSTVGSMVDFIDNKGGEAKVTDGRNTVNVGVVNANPPYIRTYADKTWTDNLLSLPNF